MTSCYFYAPDNLYLDAIFGGELFLGSEPGSQPLGLFGELRAMPLVLFQGFPYFELRTGINFPL